MHTNNNCLNGREFTSVHLFLKIAPTVSPAGFGTPSPTASTVSLYSTIRSERIHTALLLGWKQMIRGAVQFYLYACIIFAASVDSLLVRTLPSPGFSIRGLPQLLAVRVHTKVIH